MGTRPGSSDAILACGFNSSLLQHEREGWSFQLRFSQSTKGWEAFLTCALCFRAQGTGEVQQCRGESTFNRIGTHLTGRVNLGLSCKELFNFSTLNLVVSNKC